MTRLVNESIDGVRIKEFEHTFDAAGNITNITRITDSTFNSTNYTYDSNDRIYVSDGLPADPDTTRNTPVTSAAGVGILEKFRRLKQGERILFGQKKNKPKFFQP